MTERPVTVALLASLFVLGTPAVALADAAGPTDYRSVVTGLAPAVEGVRIDIVGGDSFIRLRADAGVDVVVSGYWGEPFLRIDPVGDVFENTLSPTPAQNVSRYGVSDETPTATPDPLALPVWKRIDGSGEALWHDHRVHWMSAIAAPVSGPNRLVNDWTVDITVNGLPVIVQGSLYRHAPPSKAWWAAGVAGLVAAWLVPNKRLVLLVGVVSVIVVGMLLTNRSSLPGPAAPSLVSLVPALVAALCAAAAALFAKQWWASALAVAAALTLGLAAWLQRSSVSRLLVPGSFPDSAGRAIVAVAFGVGVMAAVRSAKELV